MKTCFRYLAAIALVVVMAGCGHRAPRANGKMVVAASIGPLDYFSTRVGGELVDVTLLVPPGASPHTYQLGPDQMRVLSNASVLVLNGINLEFWAGKAVDAADNPKLIVIVTAAGLKIADSPAERDEGSGNPHVWNDPIYAIHQVNAIEAGFVKADPKHERAYRENAARLVAELRRLDRDIRGRVEKFSSKSFVAFHPAWVYFARRYGLTEAAVIESSPGKEPSPSEVRKIVDTARKIRAKAIFAEPQFSPKSARVVADEIGAKVIYLNPIGEPPDYDYFKMMRTNLARMARALK